MKSGFTLTRHPRFLHKSCPGDRHLTKELLPIIMLKTNKRGEVVSRVALVEFDYLSNANRRQKGEEKEVYLMRCALVKRQKSNEELETAEAKYQNRMTVIRESERELDMRKKQIVKSMERKREEVTKWEKELENTPFYELDTEMDSEAFLIKLRFEEERKGENLH